MNLKDGNICVLLVAIISLQDDKKFYQMELVNRETNFNKVFSAAPNVGILNPLLKVKHPTNQTLVNIHFLYICSAITLVRNQKTNQLENLIKCGIDEKKKNLSRSIKCNFICTYLKMCTNILCLHILVYIILTLLQEHCLIYI